MMPETDHTETDAAPNRALITVCVMLATVMQTLDSTIANVALPYMQGAMSASQEEISWVLTSYIVAAAVMTAPTGYLTARFGRTRLFVTSIAGFTIASVLCGLAQSLDQIVVFRVLQGMFGAALVPLSQVTLLDIYPPEQRGFSMAIWTMGALIGPILGPTLGGWLTENYNWRWVFYINVPFGGLAMLGLLAGLKETAHSKLVKLDWIGFGALGLAIGALQTLLDRGETLDWFSSPEIITEALLAGLGFYLFVVQAALSPKPFLPPRMFTDLNFVIGAAFIFMIGLVLYATMALLAPYLQTLMNYPVSMAGLVMAPRGVGSMLAALTCGRMMKTVGARQLISIGMIVSAYALYQMTLWTPDVSEMSIVTTGFIQGLGVSCITVPLSTVAFATLPAELRADGSGVFSLVRNLGSSIGISVTAALLETNSQINHAAIAVAITPFNHTLQSGAVAAWWNPASVPGAVALNAEISRQAAMIAYADDFKLMLVFMLCVLPMVLLIRSAPAPMVHAMEVET